MSDKLIEFKKVRYSYLGKFPALDGIDFSVMKGERIAVIGANGCGKSTLLHIMGGLIFPDEGQVIFSREELTQKALADEKFSLRFRMAVGLVFQNPDVQLFCPTVKEEIMFGPLNFGFKQDAIMPVFDNITDLFGIKSLIERMPHQLSIGEKKKVAMASVLISGPEVLLLDEPTAGLDPQTSRHLIDLLNEYHAHGKTIVTATHDMHILGEIADMVFVFSKDRKIVRCARPQELLADTAFLEEHNLIHAHSHIHGGKTHTHPHGHPSHDHSH